MNLKEISSKIKYLLPGYGVYKQFKKPKEERKILEIIGFSIYAIPFILKVAYLPLYIGIGTVTKEWNPSNHIKKSKRKKKTN